MNKKASSSPLAKRGKIIQDYMKLIRADTNKSYVWNTVNHPKNSRILQVKFQHIFSQNTISARRQELQ